MWNVRSELDLSCDDSADEGGVVDAASEPGSGIQGYRWRIPCRLNAAG